MEGVELMKTPFDIKMESLIKEYEAEECVFSYEANLKMLGLYLNRMEDCQLKCVIYTLMKQLDEESGSEINY